MIDRRLVLAGLTGLIAQPLSAQRRPLTPRVSPGPFYPQTIPADHDWDLVKAGDQPNALGTVILISGRVFAASGEPLPRAEVEIWHADANGRYIDPRENFSNRPHDRNFQGYGLTAADGQGDYRFRTIKPPPYPVPFPSGPVMRAPHVHFGVIVNGEKRLITQLFFEGESLNENDFELRTVAVTDRAELIRPIIATGGERHVRFDLVVA